MHAITLGMKDLPHNCGMIPPVQVCAHNYAHYCRYFRNIGVVGTCRRGSDLLVLPVEFYAVRLAAGRGADPNGVHEGDDCAGDRGNADEERGVPSCPAGPFGSGTEGLPVELNMVIQVLLGHPGYPRI